MRAAAPLERGGFRDTPCDEITTTKVPTTTMRAYTFIIGRQRSSTTTSPTSPPSSWTADERARAHTTHSHTHIPTHTSATGEGSRALRQRKRAGRRETIRSEAGEGRGEAALPLKALPLAESTTDAWETHTPHQQQQKNARKWKNLADGKSPPKGKPRQMKKALQMQPPPPKCSSINQAWACARARPPQCRKQQRKE